MAKTKKFYITTAIPYVNAAPHIGHALEFVQADAIARFHKLNGFDVFLTTGADENSLKNVHAAEKQKISVEKLCETNAKIFKGFAEKIGLSFNVFLRSSDKKSHWPGIEKLWELCNKSGDIYKKKYKGLYCVDCEAFYTEKELENGLCPEHKTKPELVEEENYFFRLSKYQEKLQKLIENDVLKIIPENKKNEILSFIKQGLEDFSVSRSVKRAKGWGIPVPGDSSQIIYVWFDALGIYLTGVGFGNNQIKFNRWWPADMHVIGKGIIRFHAIYWPAILLSTGLELPKSIFVHGYVTVEGQKMSKSLGNVAEGLGLLKKYEVDGLRYYLLKEIPTFEDGDFSEKSLVAKINNELVGNIGNFIYRALSFIHTKFGGRVPEGGELDDIDEEFEKRIKEAAKNIGNELENIELEKGLRKILEFSGFCNQYFQKKEPWRDLERAKSCLYLSINAVRSLAIALEPFLPSSAERLWNQLNLKDSVHEQKWDSLSKIEIKPKHKINRPEILFKKVEDVDIDNQLTKLR